MAFYDILSDTLLFHKFSIDWFLLLKETRTNQTSLKIHSKIDFESNQSVEHCQTVPDPTTIGCQTELSLSTLILVLNNKLKRFQTYKKNGP